MALSGNASVIASFFSGKGLSAAGVAGVLGTWQAESSLNPAITNSIGAHGLAQWLGSRRTALQLMAARMGVNENDINAQLQFAWSELSSPQYAGLLHELQTTSNPQQAARDFVNIFERPGPGGDPGAPGFAQTFFSGGVPGGSGNPGSTGTGGTITPIGNNSDTGTGWHWWEGLLGPTGGIIGTLPPAQRSEIGNTVGDVATGIAAFVQDFLKLIDLISELFKPSNWLRIGSFLVGVICLIGGAVMLKGAAL